jgi:uncharacterized protein
MSRLGVVRAPNGERLWTVDVAGSWLDRLRGLIGRSALAESEGLYFPGTNGIHMLFMRFAIDCVFVGAPREDGSHEVVAVREHLRPWTGLVPWVHRARGALELRAGAVSSAGLRVGDSLRFTTP